ncbi:MFS transporter [Terrabacter aerolatus]|uniref:MFS transporter n=1 Tax=Terrabacter aerolatus TaxID=422442 RepID=A0A512D6W6_9MICO|nr:MFS transporter [Terrabacter aerolatus]
MGAAVTELGQRAELPPRGLSHSLRAFRHRDYAVFWVGAITSNTGGWLSNLTVPFVVYEVTHSALWVGLVSAFQFVPNIALGPWGGVLADRHDRRRVLFLTQSGMALSALLLWMVWSAGVREPLAVMALVGVAGVFQGINMPSWQSFVNDLVPRSDLDSAVALNSLQFNAARSLGPAVAGLILATIGPGWALLLNALSFLAVLLALASLTVRSRPRTPDPASVWRQFATSVRYIRGQPGIQMGLLVAIAVGLLVNPIFQFTVVFAGSVFHVGPWTLGLLNAALGVGALVAAPMLAGWSHILSRSMLTRLGLIGQALGLTGFALSPSPGWAATALVVVGWALLLTISATNTAVQIIVADHLRGRVLAVRIMAYTGCFPVGGLVQGALADALGPRATVLGAGLLLLVLALVLSSWRGPLRLQRLDDLHDG